jgi:hypothetical protein
MDNPIRQDHIAPVAVQNPLLAQHLAVRANRITESPSSQAANPNPNQNSNKQAGISSGGGGPGPVDELHPDYVRSKNRLESAQATLHQLSDLIDGVLQGVSSSGYGPASTKNNQRLIKSAVSAASEIVAHAESDGERLFRIQYANLFSQSLPSQNRQAVAAYNKASEYTPISNRDPSLIRQSMNIVNLHVTGPNGILADLQKIADNGPHTTDRVKRALNDSKTTIQSLQSVITDTQVKLTQQATMTGIAQANGPLNKFL